MGEQVVRFLFDGCEEIVTGGAGSNVCEQSSAFVFQVPLDLAGVFPGHI